MNLVYKQINLPVNKELRNSIQILYGLGWHKSMLACSKAGLCYPFFINNLNIYNFNILSCILDSLSWAEAKILRLIHLRIMKHINLYSYKGSRLLNKLPVRGQRTRSNAKSCKKQFFNKL